MKPIGVAGLVYRNWLIIGLALLLGGRWLMSKFTGESVKLDAFKDVSTEESTLTDAQALALADRLHDEMEEPLTAYSYDIIQILKPLSKADFKHVYDAFGKRHYDTIMKAEGGWLFNSKLDLLTWLNHEVTGYVLTEAKKELVHLEIF